MALLPATNAQIEAWAIKYNVSVSWVLAQLTVEHTGKGVSETEDFRTAERRAKEKEKAKQKG